MKFILFDDHSIVRLGLSIIIKNEYPNSQIDDTDLCSQLIKLCRANSYDLVILDVNVPNCDIYNVVAQIKMIKSHQKILMMSMNPEKNYALRFIDLGADGYIQKSASDEEIIKALKTILAGKKYMSEDVKDLIINSHKSKTGSNPLNDLSLREFEIAMYFEKGLSSSEISTIMNLHSSTIGTYKYRIFEKLKVKNIIDLHLLVENYNRTVN
jgi:two-component system, NarL family, invasion response regulator UvrY